MVMAENIVMYYDDLTDSDNWATARFLQHAAHKNPSIHVIWIVEPRQVAFGLSMTRAQINACKDLLKSHFPSRGDPFKLLLGGLIQQSDLDRLEGLTEHERDLLRLAIKPGYGPKDDAILHGRLMALDLLSSLSSWCSNPVDVFLDVETLDSLENPVNLNMHYHEELVARTEGELEDYQAIMTEPYPQRVESLREWYRRCIKPLEKEAMQNGNAVNNLDFELLCRQAKAAKSVKFFGGSSLGLLQRLMERHVVNNMQCYLQAGAFDLSKNLFPNQFNIALNLDAAKFVFANFHEFSRFLIIPTDTAKCVLYSLTGLGTNAPSLGRRCLGFNCHVDSMKLATGEVTLDDFPDRSYLMSDLTAFLCAFWGRFRGSTLAYARLVENGDQLFLAHENSGIPVYEVHEDILLEKSEILNILSELVVDREPSEIGEPGEPGDTSGR